MARSGSRWIPSDRDESSGSFVIVGLQERGCHTGFHLSLTRGFARV